MMIGVWIIAILVSFVPMPVLYKIIGIVVSIVFIAVSTSLARRNNRLTTTSLVINLIVIGWDLAVLYSVLSVRYLSLPK